ncbi:MAG TPA: hypothetical protein VHW09_11080 [Bryobacteraceae bacterium]|jgi:Flp pilus assembly pilin Flp|nr:hypothetical protein [Bryobacteraceae bacterium]
MQTSRRFRKNQKGQCSVEYTLLVGLVVLMIVVFAREYQLSIRGVARTATSTLSAAGQALPAGTDGSSTGGGSHARGWRDEPALTPRALTDKLKPLLK